ncbi:MAG: acyltransferase, partial [Nitrososphaera sp.]|nr:acyltransferase [Nitrososphaera sp.]
MNPMPEGRIYYPALDVLRGIAILLVVAYHNFGYFPYLRFGWLGVDLFFVLSGFLITDILLTSKQDRNYFRNFYARRFLRIFPLYYLTLILFYAASPFLFSQQGAGSVYAYYHQNQFWYWLLGQNWLIADKGIGPVPYLGHFWSLAVEEQFYLIWPFVVFLIKNLKKLRHLILFLILLAVIVRVIVWIQNPEAVNKYYCNTFTRMDSLLMGSLLSVLLKEGKIIPRYVIQRIFLIWGVFVAVVLCLYKNIDRGNPLLATVGYTLFAVCFTAIIYVFISEEFTFFDWIKKMAVLKYIGKISY